MMRVAASIPLGPIRFKTFLADARNRYVVNIVATMAAETATKDTNSNFECFTSEVIPSTAAMPPRAEHDRHSQGYECNVFNFLGRAAGDNGCAALTA